MVAISALLSYLMPTQWPIRAFVEPLKIPGVIYYPLFFIFFEFVTAFNIEPTGIRGILTTKAKPRSREAAEPQSRAAARAPSLESAAGRARTGRPPPRDAMPPAQRLPSIHDLSAFEAAARLGGFAPAAADNSRP